MTNKKQITQKLAKEKYGILISKMQKLDKIKFYLLDNGNVIDSTDSIRYIAPKKQRCFKYKNTDCNCEKCNIEWYKKNTGKSPNCPHYINSKPDGWKFCTQCVKPNKYHKELKNALALLARIAEENGQYGEDKEAELKAVELLETFISNRI